MNTDPRTLAARHTGLTPLHASVILAQCCDERKVWTRILSEDDPRVVLGAMQFLVSMRDGRPSQQINLTSFNLSVTAEDIATARDIIRELRSPSVPQRMISESEGVHPVFAPRTIGESIMLLEDEGAKKDSKG